MNEQKKILEDKESKITIMPREDKEERYTTLYCQTELGFDDTDIKETLKNLKAKDYVETYADKRLKKTAPFNVFAKKINGKQVYIKVKIQSYSNKAILCMSFHFSEFEITRFPYR